MSDKSTIEWTDATWPVVQGCDPVSEGCVHCYAVPLLWRLAHNPNVAPVRGLTEIHVNAAGEKVKRFTGKLALREDRLTWPMQWKKPRMIFVPSHGDIFHKDVPDSFLDKIFAVMALCPQHTFQVLTKRAERMREYLSAQVKGPWAGRVVRVDPDGTAHPEWDCAFRVRSALGEIMPQAPGRALNDATDHLDKLYGEDGYDGFMPRWPLPNVWLGVSCERQQEADERIPLLLQTPAAVRFISAEPLLGAIDLRGIRADDGEVLLNVVDGIGSHYSWGSHVSSTRKLDWVIVGGESGPKARPMHPQWARDIRDQCAAAGVAFFFKQWGEIVDADIWFDDLKRGPSRITNGIDGKKWEPQRPLNFEDAAILATICGRKFEHQSDGSTFIKVGKKAAGRLLDGREHNEFPKTEPESVTDSSVNQSGLSSHESKNREAIS